MMIADLDDSTRLFLFRASVLVMHGANPEDLERLKEAKDAWEAAHTEEICENIFRFLDDPSIQLDPNEEECDSCDGTGLMEGWNRRDGSSCPKCKGAGVVLKDA
jgi:hypothetical protein